MSQTVPSYVCNRQTICTDADVLFIFSLFSVSLIPLPPSPPLCLFFVSSERTYYLHSTRPDLVSFKRRTMSIAAGDVGRIGAIARETRLTIDSSVLPSSQSHFAFLSSLACCFPTLSFRFSIFPSSFVCTLLITLIFFESVSILVSLLFIHWPHHLFSLSFCLYSSPLSLLFLLLSVSSSVSPFVIYFLYARLSVCTILFSITSLGIRVRPSSVIGRHEVIVFVNNEQGQSEEAFKVYISYYAADGDTSWA